MTRPILKFFFLLGFFFAIAGVSAYLTLTLVIESEETIVVPELKNKNAITVLKRLSDLGLNTKVKGSEYNADIPLHHVIYQDPRPGTIIKKGRDVKIVLSKGPETFSVPNLNHIKLQQAEAIIANNGLQCGVITRAFSQTVRKDFVIAHTPEAGSKVRRNDPVNLLISRGPRPAEYVMPDLEGMSLEEAVQIIEKYGLTVGQIDSVCREDQAVNIIIDQEPFSGYYVESNQQVSLSVNRWNQQRDADETYSDDPGILFRYRIPQGILKQHIRLEMNISGISTTIYDELMAPDREIWLMVPKYTDTAVFLFKNEELIKTEVYSSDN